jgi:hypothetical protein
MSVEQKSIISTLSFFHNIIVSEIIARKSMYTARTSIIVHIAMRDSSGGRNGNSQLQMVKIDCLVKTYSIQSGNI